MLIRALFYLTLYITYVELCICFSLKQVDSRHSYHNENLCLLTSSAMPMRTQHKQLVLFPVKHSQKQINHQTKKQHIDLSQKHNL